MTSKVKSDFLDKYSTFVSKVTSDESNEFNSMMERLKNLQENNEEINISLLLTSSLGLSSESGEFTELCKKFLFQKKEMTSDNIYHAKRELGDIIWYWINACRALNFNPNDVIEENVKKLEKRYPGGSFSGFYSENRQKNDL